MTKQTPHMKLLMKKLKELQSNHIESARRKVTHVGAGAGGGWGRGMRRELKPVLLAQNLTKLLYCILMISSHRGTLPHLCYFTVKHIKSQAL